MGFVQFGETMHESAEKNFRFKPGVWAHRHNPGSQKQKLLQPQLMFSVLFLSPMTL